MCARETEKIFQPDQVHGTRAYSKLCRDAMSKERASGLAALSLVRFRYICVLDRRHHPELDLDTLEWQGETPR